MITVIETNKGYLVAVDGKVLATVDEHGHRVAPAYFTAAQAEEARAALAAALTPERAQAVTPAKWRVRPEIQRYPITK